MVILKPDNKTRFSQQYGIFAEHRFNRGVYEKAKTTHPTTGDTYIDPWNIWKDMEDHSEEAKLLSRSRRHVNQEFDHAKSIILEKAGINLISKLLQGMAPQR